MISYIRIPLTEIHRMKDLWQQLNDHHYKQTPVFREDFVNYTFEDRIKKITSKVSSKENILIDLVIDEKENKPIGYCITTINEEHNGEIDSLYVDDGYRGYKIGANLMERAVRWMDERDVNTQIIGVVAGNEDVLDFYKRYEFYPKAYVLKRKK